MAGTWSGIVEVTTPAAVVRDRGVLLAPHEPNVAPDRSRINAQVDRQRLTVDRRAFGSASPHPPAARGLPPRGEAVPLGSIESHLISSQGQTLSLSKKIGKKFGHGSIRGASGQTKEPRKNKLSNFSDGV